MPDIEIRALHREFGKEFRQAYEELNQKLDASDTFNPDVHVGVLAISRDRPVGCARLDLGSCPPQIGWLYVEPEFRGREIAITIRNTPWLGAEPGYNVRQYMIKAEYLIGRRAGNVEIGSYFHNERARKFREWRDSQSPRWEVEVALLEPHELIEMIRKR
jgi:GNAT superfamily N-acetyltransferase